MKEKDSPDPIYLRLKEALNVKTDRQLAEALDVTPQSVNGWKRSGKIKRDRLQTVASLTGVRYGWLLTGEGEKYLAKKSVRTEQTASDGREAFAQLALSASPLLLRSLPIVGKLSNSQLIETTGETMNVPIQIGSESSVVLTINSDDWISEGLRPGDLIIAQPLDGESPDGRLVVATCEGKAVIRRFEQRGQLAHFSALQSGPSFSFPLEAVKVNYLVTAIVHPQ